MYFYTPRCIISFALPFFFVSKYCFSLIYNYFKNLAFASVFYLIR